MASLADRVVTAATLAPGSVGTAQIVSTQVPRRVTGVCAPQAIGQQILQDGTSCHRALC